MKSTARRLTLLAFLVYAVTGGGRIVGSDEVTMLELSRSLLHGRIDVPEGATAIGARGLPVTKNAAGQAVMALPLVAAGEVMAAAAPEARRPLVTRFVASFLNAGLTAVLLGVFYAAARGLGVRVLPALAASLLLGFATPLWVYAKSFMAEPLEALGLLLVLAGSAGDGSKRRWTAALGALLAVSAKLSVTPLAILCALPLVSRPRRAWPVLGGFALALVGHALYDWARFGNPFETGYGMQATPAAYTTPLLVGLYGLLISSGKGVLWFAPSLWLAPAGWRRMVTAGGRARAAAVAGLTATIFALGLYGTFQHWAGDGSFGPRYLVPILPLVFLGVAFAFDQASRRTRVAAVALGLAGVLVQIGGVSIHFGAQMREAGDYPYRLPLSDPRFMSDSHFNPRFSPLADHWRMLVRNLGEHLRGQAPRLGGGGIVDPRIGVGVEDQRRLLHALDYWWLYAGYAGVPRAPLGAAALLLVALAAVAARNLGVAARAEARSP